LHVIEHTKSFLLDAVDAEQKGTGMWTSPLQPSWSSALLAQRSRYLSKGEQRACPGPWWLEIDARLERRYVVLEGRVS